MEFKELMNYIMENQEVAIIYFLVFSIIVSLTTYHIPIISEKIVYQKEPGRIYSEWELVSNRTVATKNGGITYHKVDNRNINIWNDNKGMSDDGMQFKYIVNNDQCKPMIDMPEVKTVDDLTINDGGLEHLEWAMDESSKSVTPYEHGGYDMDNGNSFNDDFMSSADYSSCNDFSNSDPFGFW